MTEPMTPAALVVELFGGLRPLANALKIDASGVRSWQRRGLIPSNHQSKLLDLAAERGIKLTAEDVVRGRG